MTKSILDRTFRYVPAVATDVAVTWKQFGFTPEANVERRTRLQSGPIVQGEPSEMADLSEVIRRVAAARRVA